TFGVADIVRTGEEPAPVPDEILAALREREAAGLFDQLDPARRLRLGEMVRITAGAFEDMIGRLVELRDQDRVVVLLDLMGRAVRAQLGAAAVEAA
ncbi:MAG: transcription termination/antitermination protein NusG, partial [Stellaceae bacterium]